MSSAGNENSKWEFANWSERNYADSMAEVTTPPTNSHMASNSEGGGGGGGSVGNISGTLRQSARDFYNDFARENTLHRDCLSAMAAEAEIAAPTAMPDTRFATAGGSEHGIFELLQLNEPDSINKHSVENTFYRNLTSAVAAEAEIAAPTAKAATSSMPDTRAAGDYDDNSWESSPLQAPQYQQHLRLQLQLQLQQFYEQLYEYQELLSSSSQVEFFNTTHSQQQFGTLTHDVTSTVGTTTTQVVDNSNTEINIYKPSPTSCTLPIARKDLMHGTEFAGAAAKVAPMRLRKSVGGAVTRWVIITNAPDSPNVQRRRGKFETERRRCKSNLIDYDVGTSSDSESDESESRFMAPPRKKPPRNYKYYANMTGLRRL